MANMVQPKGDGLITLVVTIITLVLSWIVVSLRVFSRYWLIDSFGQDDWLMVIGLILYTVTCVLVIIICYYGAGYHADELDHSLIQQGTKLYFIAEFIYATCTVPIKWSISVALIRIAGTRRGFTWIVWGIMAISSVSALLFIIGLPHICHPIGALWGEVPGKCNASLNSSLSYFLSVVSIVTDWALAGLPIFMLWNLQLKRRIKIYAAFILSLGAFASSATIVRLRYLVLYNNQSEFLFSVGKIAVWSILEEGIGIIAGSLPTLRPVLKYLHLLGSTYVNDSREPTSGAYSQAPHHQIHRRHPGAFRMDTFDATTEVETGHTQQNQSDGESAKHILKETGFTVTSEASPSDWMHASEVGEWNNRRSG